MADNKAHNTIMLYLLDMQTQAMLAAAALNMDSLNPRCINPLCVNLQNGMAMWASAICTQCKYAYCSYCSYSACLTCQVTTWYKL